MRKVEKQAVLVVAVLFLTVFAIESANILILPNFTTGSGIGDVLVSTIFIVVIFVAALMVGNYAQKRWI